VAPDQAGLFFDLVGVVLEGIHAAAPVGLTTRGKSVQGCLLNIYSAVTIYFYLDAVRSAGQGSPVWKNQKNAPPVASTGSLNSRRERLERGLQGDSRRCRGAAKKIKPLDFASPVPESELTVRHA
jgi:hypothetical protein